jgi:hypothetical protein
MVAKQIMCRKLKKMGYYNYKKYDMKKYIISTLFIIGFIQVTITQDKIHLALNKTYAAQAGINIQTTDPAILLDLEFYSRMVLWAKAEEKSAEAEYTARKLNADIIELKKIHTEDTDYKTREKGLSEQSKQAWDAARAAEFEAARYQRKICDIKLKPSVIARTTYQQTFMQLIHTMPSIRAQYGPLKQTKPEELAVAHAVNEKLSTFIQRLNDNATAAITMQPYYTAHKASLDAYMLLFVGNAQ